MPETTRHEGSGRARGGAGAMTLAAGTFLGPYRVAARIGAGGMGEVYRARDTNLGRDVAIKVLPARFVGDAQALSRFRREAKAVAALSHPNILAIHDFGESAGVHYAVTELLEGETLRDKLLRGPLSVRRAVDYATQTARGLAAAHERGIVHRDLKPENLFVTRDGRLKILDFGLAKNAPRAASAAPEEGPTDVSATAPGTLLGSPGYMSPEQIRGLPADHRTDLFALGAVLYEMLAGRRAFLGATPADTLTAILREEPPDLAETRPQLPVALQRIVRHCLEKDPEARAQSAHDLTFELEGLAAEAAPAAVQTEVRRSLPRRRLLPLGLAAALALGGALAGVVVGRVVRTPDRAPSFQRLTFRRGIVDAARFAPDGQTIVYGAAWNGQPFEVFTTRPDSTEARSLGPRGASVLALSPTGELALSENRRPAGDVYWNVGAGTLARAPLAGGALHQVLESVLFADFSPDGKELAVVRRKGRRVCLEYPLGKALYETDGWIADPRVSPGGDQVAFLDYPALGWPAGAVALVDRQGRKRTLATGFIRQDGLAWSPRGDEVWFTATRRGSARALYAVSPEGRERPLLRVPGALTLHDTSRDGRVLLSSEDFRRELRAKSAGETAERDLSWLDYSLRCGLSADGSLIAFSEFGEAGGASWETYVRKADGSPPVRLADATCFDLSPDGKWVIAFTSYLAPKTQAVLYPTGTGQPRLLPTEQLDVQQAGFFPDGKRILIAASPPGKPLRTFIQDLEGGRAQALSPEGTSATAPDLITITGDSRFFVARDPEGRALLWPIAGGKPRALPGFEPNEDAAVLFPADGRTLLVYRFREMPMPVVRLDLATGRREPWRRLAPPDPAGVVAIDGLNVSPDLAAYVYHYIRRQSDLYLVEGIR
jgi:eukaryotic-like serine/threonine-protein kinase